MPKITYAEIIPLVRLPRSIDFLDYIAPNEMEQKIKIGVMVKIPFRNKEIFGIVWRIKDKTEINTPLLNIIDVAESEPIIDYTHLRLIHSIAKDYFISPGLFLKSVLPEIPKRFTKTKIQTPTNNIISQTVSKTTANQIAIILQKFKNHKRNIIHTDDNNLVLGCILTLASKISKDNNLLILFPIREQALNFFNLLKEKGLDVSITLPTDSKNKTYELWKLFKNKQISVLIGTPAAIFFPMPRGGVYILIDESAGEWKQSEINPRIDARIILPKLQNELGARYLVFTPFIRTETFFTSKNETNNHFIRQPQTTNLINLGEHNNFNKNIFSETLSEAIQNKKNILMFVARKGNASLVRCADCGFVLKCEICDLPLALHQKFLRCPACKAQTPLLLVCPSCHGAKFNSYGIGTEEVQKEFNNLFPQTNATITTTSFLNIWPITSVHTPKFDLVSIVEADSVLLRPDFRSQEKLARILDRLMQIANLNSAPFYIQTNFPDSPVWQIVSNNPSVFYKTELSDREKLHYPPFWRMIKLIFQNKDARLATNQAAKIKNLFQTSESIEIIGPYLSTPNKIRNSYRELLLVKFLPEKFEALRPIFNKLPDDIIIDVDPADILR